MTTGKTIALTRLNKVTFKKTNQKKNTPQMMLVFKSKDFVYFEHWPDSSIDETWK